jgi:glycosyltransferase involved in cell wall biosynthesis
MWQPGQPRWAFRRVSSNQRVSESTNQRRVIPAQAGIQLVSECEMSSIKVAFVMEQHLGHRTFYQNLRSFIAHDRSIAPTWIEVNYAPLNNLLEKLPLPGSIRGALRGRAQVRHGLAHARCDVAFFNTQVPAALGGSMTKRQPYVISTDITPRQYDVIGQHYGHRADRGGPLAAYKHRTNVTLLRGATKVLPWSTWTRESLIANYGVSVDRIEVLPPGVDTDRWQPTSRSAHGPLKILFVGGDLQRKGGETLLAAFRSLPPGKAELHLVTRTPAPSGDNIRTYHGLQPNQAELIAIYQQCDVFVLPTEAEAFGIAAIEASAVGMPVIATAVGGLTDIVIDGQTGYVIKPGDIRTLADRLQSLIAQPALRQQLGQAARERAVSRFDARANAQRIAHLLSETVSQLR